MEKVPSAQGSQGDDIRAMALAGEEQRLQEGQYGLREVRGCGGQANSTPCGNAARYSGRHSSPQALLGARCWGSPPFPGEPGGQCCQGIGPTEREELVGLTCHEAEAALAGLVLHAGLAAGVRAVHASPALAHRVVRCVSLRLHDEAGVWAKGAWAR